MSNLTSFYSQEELIALGFKSIGKNVLISRKASFYSSNNIEIGDNVRIDDFCILSGKIIIGNYVHISAFNALYGAFGIELKDYSGISPRCTLFSASDDFSGNSLIGPLVPKDAQKVIEGKITLEKFAQLGSGTTVLPGCKIAEGSVTGAMSLVTKSLDGWGIYSGIPAKLRTARSKNLMDFIK